MKVRKNISRNSTLYWLCTLYASTWKSYMTLNCLNCDTVIWLKMIKTKVRCTCWALHDVNSNLGLWCVSGTLVCFWIDLSRWFFKCTACLDGGWKMIDTSPQLIEKTGLVQWKDIDSTFLAKSKARIKCNFSVVNWPWYSVMLPATHWDVS